MSTDRSQLVAGIYSYAGDPEDAPLRDGGLPLNLAFEVVYDCETEMLRDVDLSDQNRRVSKMDVTLSGTGFSVNRSDWTAPLRLPANGRRGRLRLPRRDSQPLGATSGRVRQQVGRGLLRHAPEG
jgi:hypothetical protein